MYRNQIPPRRLPSSCPPAATILTPVVDVTSYDRNMRAALLLQDCDLTNRECVQILGLFALVVGVVVGVVMAVLS